LLGIGCNPNVHSILLVGTGCEPFKAEELANEISKTKKQVDYVTLESEGNYEKVINKGEKIVMNMVQQASQISREQCDVKYLTLGIKCGGSSPLSAIASNPSVGRAVDMLIAEGGTVIFTETAEVIGAEQVLVKRAVNQKVAQKLEKVVRRMKKMIEECGIDIRGSEPTLGNIKAGLTTLEEKSLGAIIKGGTTSLMGVLDYATKPNSNGLYFMDGPSDAPQIFLGTFSAGAQIQIFSYGGGLPAMLRGLPSYPGGLKVLPVLKIVSSLENIDEKRYFDIYAGNIIENNISIDNIGNQIFEEILKTASGKFTINETCNNYYEPMKLYATGGGLLM
jgi:altronate dehydratase large subunit